MEKNHIKNLIVETKIRINDYNERIEIYKTQIKNESFKIDLLNSLNKIVEDQKSSLKHLRKLLRNLK